MSVAQLAGNLRDMAYSTCIATQNADNIGVVLCKF